MAAPSVSDKYIERALKRRRGAGTHQVQARNFDIIQQSPRTRAQSKEEGVSPTINLKYGTSKADVHLEPISASPVQPSPLSTRPHNPSRKTPTEFPASAKASKNVLASRQKPTEPLTPIHAIDEVPASRKKPPAEPRTNAKITKGTAEKPRKSLQPDKQVKKAVASRKTARKPSQAAKLKEASAIRKRPRERTPPEDQDSDDDNANKTKAITMYKMSTAEATQLNPVDVVSSEISDIIKDYMTQTEDSASRRLLSFFREEIATRFLEQSDLVDEHVLLDSALRKARQNKKILRTDLVAVQQQRDKVRISLEKAEKDYEEAEKGRRRLHDVNEFLINLEVLRNESRPQEIVMDYLLALIAKVTPRVSNGGTFAQLRRFNEIIEQLDSHLSEL